MKCVSPSRDWSRFTCLAKCLRQTCDKNTNKCTQSGWAVRDRWAPRTGDISQRLLSINTAGLNSAGVHELPLICHRGLPNGHDVSRMSRWIKPAPASSIWWEDSYRHSRECWAFSSPGTYANGEGEHANTSGLAAFDADFHTNQGSRMLRIAGLQGRGCHVISTQVKACFLSRIFESQIKVARHRGFLER